jgi:hypothetical protein
MPMNGQAIDFTNIALDEPLVCAIPAERHKYLLASYLVNLKRGRNAVRKMIVDDFWLFRDLGAQERAADLMLVWKMYLSDCATHARVARSVLSA